MPVSKNINGTWTEVKHIWVNVNGAWTKVRRLFKNVAGVWTQYHADNDFTAYSLGLLQNQTAAANRGVWVNGSQAFSGLRSYNLVSFDKYGNIVFQRAYDIYGEAQDGAPSSSPYGSTQFVTDAGALPTGQLFIVTTYDEPQTGNLKAPLTNFINGMFSLGATAAVFQNPNFAYRGAYMLMGKKGSAGIFEAYRGTLSTNIGANNDSGCLDGAIQVTFNIVDGQFANIARVM